jgi:hypothetical protein
MTETLATFLAVLALYALTHHERNRTVVTATVAGAAAGLAVLCRPTFLPWLCLLVLLQVSQLTSRSRVLLLGNNPSFYEHLRRGGHFPWDARPLFEAWDLRWGTAGADDVRWTDLKTLPASVARPQLAPAGELQDDKLAYALAFRYIREQPWMFLRASWHRVMRFWGWTPVQLTAENSTRTDWLRRVVGVWYFLISLAALAGMTSLRGQLVRPPWLWGLLLCLVFTAVHAIYWSDMRMRAPCVPILCLLSAAGLRCVFHFAGSSPIPFKQTVG